MKIEFTPIGIIRSPFTELEGIPIQPPGAAGVKGTIEVFEDFRSGLKDLESFSHIILLYHFHRSHGFNLDVVPFLDSEPRGLFATRAPKRPNPIGLSVVQLDKIEDGVLYIQLAHMLVDLANKIKGFEDAVMITLLDLEDERDEIQKKINSIKKKKQ